MTTAARRGGIAAATPAGPADPADSLHPGQRWLSRELASPPGRVVIEHVRPAVNGGRFPVKRVVGDVFTVTASIFAEGHDQLSAILHYRRRGARSWSETAMTLLRNDQWQGGFPLESLGMYEYYVTGCVDEFASWRHALERKVRAGLEVSSELLEGARIVESVATHAEDDRTWLGLQARDLREGTDRPARIAAALDPQLLTRMTRHLDRGRATRSEPVLLVDVDRERARSGAWYEMFPRSASPEPGRHGTFADCIDRLPYVASMGFDVLYLPPIHPIGVTHRKGRNNARVAESGDVGSPWAIGSADGGHDAVHPALGTLADFDRLLEEAKLFDIEIALDIAWQCSPDHPWIREHPEWFRHRPDGTIQYAENPPKKYEDIVPLHFATPRWRELWEELLRVVRFWIDRGVKIFRVDNPHTKPFAFWEWLIRTIKDDHPDVIFLSEAFTRPSVMRYLAKCGFTQSYTYFTWRNTKEELTEYLTELCNTEIADYLRPNLFANTPDILHEVLQSGGRAAHQIRFVLAATLAGSYGIYGPHFELAESRAVAGTEEYLDSEKYQLRHWQLDQPASLAPFIGHVNRIRRENPAFRHPERLRFLTVDNEHLIAYTRSTPDGGNLMIVVVNLSPYHAHRGWLELPLEALGLEADQPFQAHDLLSNARFLWRGSRNFVALDPREAPAHIFRVRRRLRTEHDFDYYM
ncbi:MAG TPA: alpha-1,4-glucan--maltose-1-phosphate maltosyltransferase [Gemmatimonadaceae bacterium]|nr:alpha-1,4-glucan--maltose-1-phosphate maltosyltransferase [Gemmatimonadaceae bacterium]